MALERGRWAVMKRAGRYILRFILTACGFALVLVGASLLLRPDLSGPANDYIPEQIQAARQLRAIHIDKDNPPVIYRSVDYEEKSASWHPQEEPPVLADLVETGDLPPVVQRVGDEPLVLEGVEGIGKYGGTWYRLSPETGLPGEIASRLSYVSLVRWSPQGYPIVPHVAKSWEISDDNRVFTFHLRRGMKWSDGHPFTTADIVFWWQHIANDKDIMARVPDIMKVRGKTGMLEAIDEYTFQITFPESNGAFLARLASDGMSGLGEYNANMLSYPAHYLSRYHPAIGDHKLIESLCQSRRMPSAVRLFRQMITNLQQYPDYPRLWPWIYQRYTANPPFTLVRNPYYFAVDLAGNQLPYIDRLVFQAKTNEMIAIAAANGQVGMQGRYIPYEEYTHLMSQRDSGGYELYHWYPGDRSLFLIAVNINYQVRPDEPETLNKSQLLNEVRFRRALSLAINRRAIIKAEYNGQAEPAQCMPPPESFFYDEESYRAYTGFDSVAADKLLDGIGLANRDMEGMRTFGDGTRMTFYLNMALSWGSPGIAQMIVDDWAVVGVRAIPRFRNRDLFYIEKMGLQQEFTVWIGNSEFLPIVSPRYFVPETSACNYAIAFAQWFGRGGLYDSNPDAATVGIAPPPGHPCREVMNLYDKACSYSDPMQQKEYFDKILRINVENLWTINVSTPPPVLTIVDSDMHNVPRDVVSCWEFKSPGNAGIETYYFQNPDMSDEIVADIQDAILNVQMPQAGVLGVDGSRSTSISQALAKIIRWSFILVAALLVIHAAVRHPYIARRLAIMVPTLLVISIIIFLIIQAPPGDYLTSRIMMLEEQGDTAQLQQIEELRKMFWLDRSLPAQYAHWMGLYWFVTFDSKDMGLLQGDLGRSMSGGQSVNQLVGDRIILTILISLGTILLTWIIAIPVGIYSAVRQYSPTDYFFSFLSFLGMSVPSFLLALILMHLAKICFGVEISGLFSSEFAAQPHWNWGKFLDLIKHIWLPVVVLGVGGTANMIRIMRGNLLDELRKPYVETALAKGLGPVRLLLKYPVRIALNPFISCIGGIFPQLVSGGAIVAMVLSLPTVGPLMLHALMMEDMYLAGSMLMVLSMLGVIGTLVSDLLLLWLDPRIRFSGTSH